MNPFQMWKKNSENTRAEKRPAGSFCTMVFSVSWLVPGEKNTIPHPVAKKKGKPWRKTAYFVLPQDRMIIECH